MENSSAGFENAERQIPGIAPVSTEVVHAKASALLSAGLPTGNEVFTHPICAPWNLERQLSKDANPYAIFLATLPAEQRKDVRKFVAQHQKEDTSSFLEKFQEFCENSHIFLPLYRGLVQSVAAGALSSGDMENGPEGGDGNDMPTAAGEILLRKLRGNLSTLAAINIAEILAPFVSSDGSVVVIEPTALSLPKTLLKKQWPAVQTFTESSRLPRSEDSPGHTITKGVPDKKTRMNAHSAIVLDCITTRLTDVKEREMLEWALACLDKKGVFITVQSGEASAQSLGGIGTADIPSSLTSDSRRMLHAARTQSAVCTPVLTLAPTRETLPMLTCLLRQTMPVEQRDNMPLYELERRLHNKASCEFPVRIEVFYFEESRFPILRKKAHHAPRANSPMKTNDSPQSTMPVPKDRSARSLLPFVSHTIQVLNGMIDRDNIRRMGNAQREAGGILSDHEIVFLAEHSTELQKAAEGPDAGNEFSLLANLRQREFSPNDDENDDADDDVDDKDEEDNSHHRNNILGTLAEERAPERRRPPAPKAQRTPSSAEPLPEGANQLLQNILRELPDINLKRRTFTERQRIAIVAALRLAKEKASLRKEYNLPQGLTHSWEKNYADRTINDLLTLLETEASVPAEPSKEDSDETADVTEETPLASEVKENGSTDVVSIQTELRLLAAGILTEPLPPRKKASVQQKLAAVVLTENLSEKELPTFSGRYNIARSNIVRWKRDFAGMSPEEMKCLLTVSSSTKNTTENLPVAAAGEDPDASAASTETSFVPEGENVIGGVHDISETIRQLATSILTGKLPRKKHASVAQKIAVLALTEELSPKDRLSFLLSHDVAEQNWRNWSAKFTDMSPEDRLQILQTAAPHSEATD